LRLSIRPKSLRFSEPPTSAPNVFRGTLLDTVYLGEVAQHRFSVTGGGADFKAFEFNPRRIARDEAVEAVAWIDPTDVIPLVP
jgi:hypothetical protein